MNTTQATATLICEKGARRVTRAEIAALPTPEARGPRHAPQAAHTVLHVLTEALREGGFEVQREELALYRHGEVLIGVMDLSTTDSELYREGQVPSISIRTSINKEFATTLGTGQRLMVCSNGCFHAQRVVMRRRSTLRIDLRDEVMRAVDRYREHSLDLLSQMDRAKEIRLTDLQAKEIMFDEFRRKTLPPSKLPSVAEWYFDPPEGATDLTEAPRSVYHLQNAFTREARSLRLARRYEVSTRLGRLLTVA